MLFAVQIPSGTDIETVHGRHCTRLPGRGQGHHSLGFERDHVPPRFHGANMSLHPPRQPCHSRGTCSSSGLNRAAMGFGSSRVASVSGNVAVAGAVSAWRSDTGATCFDSTRGGQPNSDSIVHGSWSAAAAIALASLMPAMPRSTSRCERAANRCPSASRTNRRRRSSGSSGAMPNSAAMRSTRIRASSSTNLQNASRPRKSCSSTAARYALPQSTSTDSATVGAPRNLGQKL